MNIIFGQHIINLLKEHECVVLPGIGGLLLKHVAAHSSHGQIYPASKIIRFNRNISNDAELLVSSLINESGLTYIEAKQEVQNFVGRIKFQLTQKGFCDIDTLGRFSLTEDDNVKFIANASIKNLDKDNFGFSSLHAFPIYRVIIEDKQVTETKVVELITEQHTVRKIRKTSLVGLVATFVMMLGIFSLILTNTTVDSFKVQDANVLNFLVPSSNSTVKHEGIIRSPESKKPRKSLEKLESEDKIEGKTDVINPLIQHVLKVNNENNLKGYYIVIGAFGSIANANKAKYKHSVKNVCKIFKTDNGLYRVAIYASENAQDALVLVTEFKKKNSSYWLMENY
tara:strand:- start:2381 stop:3400 length:1020 start_codon:yes stop_codon:yes gene_type:complete